MTSNEEWGFTCEKCHFRPSKDSAEDYVRVARANPTWRYSHRSFNLKYPERCRDCERNKKRFQRMRRRLTKIYDVAEALGEDDYRYRRPKLITFALPSTFTFSEDGKEELAALKKLLPAARKILSEHEVQGGVYVPEMTTRSYQDIGGMGFKHHAHVHMVAVAPFIHKTKLKEFCEILIPLGLKRINYVAPRDIGSKGRVTSYISKYLTKDGRVCASFGIIHQSKTSHHANMVDLTAKAKPTTSAIGSSPSN